MLNLSKMKGFCKDFYGITFEDCNSQLLFLCALFYIAMIMDFDD